MPTSKKNLRRKQVPKRRQVKARASTARKRQAPRSGHGTGRQGPASAQEVMAAIAKAFGEPHLTLELVPRSCWHSNLNKQLPRRDWDRLRKPVFTAAKNRCEICGRRGDQWPVECHERWQYDDMGHVQTLVGFIALCPDCHLVKHLGRARAHGEGERAEAHLSRINGWNSQQTSRYIKLCMVLWRLRNRHDWRQDFHYLETTGVSSLSLSHQQSV